MAFGKNPEVRKSVASFRQATAAASKPVGKRGRGGGGVPYYVDMYHPQLGVPDIIRLVPGEYLQDQVVGEGENIRVEQALSTFVKFVEHFDGARQKGANCSAGALANFKDLRQPCFGCDIYWETAQKNESTGRWESTRMGRQNKYAFSVYDYGVYHKLEQYDRTTGQVKINNKTQQPFFNWVKCIGQGCDACRAQKETKAGYMTHWPINYTQLQVLRTVESEIGRSCVTCGSVDSVISRAWLCPACGECAVDMFSTELKKDELLQLTDNPVQCTYCKEVGLLTELYECGVCKAAGNSGVRATLFDVDLKVMLIEGGNGKSLQVMGWSPPGAVAPQFAGEVKPVDLIGRYAPHTLEFQAKQFGVTMAPKTNQTAAPQQPQHMQQQAPPPQQPMRAPQTQGWPSQQTAQQAPAAMASQGQPQQRYTVPYSK
jgi:hypothetical protein